MAYKNRVIETEKVVKRTSAQPQCDTVAIFHAAWQHLRKIHLWPDELNAAWEMDDVRGFDVRLYTAVTAIAL